MGAKHGKHNNFVEKVANKPGRGRSGTLILSQPQDTNDINTTSNWKPLRRNGRVLYDFDGGDGYVLSLKMDELIEIYEHSEGWYRGAVLSTPPRNGIFPSAYVELDESVPNDRDRTNSQKSDVMKRLEEIRAKKRQLQQKMLQLEKETEKKTLSSPTGSSSLKPPLFRKHSRRASIDPTVHEDVMESFDILADERDLASIVDIRDLLPTFIDNMSTEQVNEFIKEAADDNATHISREKYAKVMFARNWLGNSRTQSNMSLSSNYHTRRSQISVTNQASEEQTTEADALDILHVMDPDNKGYVDTVELLEVIDEIVNDNIDDIQLERMLAEADPNFEGRISRKQFLKMIKMVLEPPPDDAYQHMPIFSRKRTDTLRRLT